MAPVEGAKTPFVVQARELAATVLYRLEGAKTTLDQLLADTDPQISKLGRADRALFHALVYGILRHRSLLDTIIDQHVRRSSRKMDPLIRVILRLGVYQLKFMDRIPPSAAVHTSVELAKRVNKKWATGFVNGLLRSVARSDRPASLPDPLQDPAAFLAGAYSFPQWLVRRWLNRWGFDFSDALCQAINQIPPVTIRTNTLKTSRSALLAAIEAGATGLEPCRHSPDGIHVTSVIRPMDQWRAFHDGGFQVQSEAAQMVSLFLGPKPGQRVWDTCAGLGTKTAHLAQLMENRGQLLATDRHPGKLNRLQAEMSRLGIGIVTNRTLDLLSAPADWNIGLFDRILLDAPCSGLGVLQRNPDGKWNTTMADIRSNQKRQLALIDKVARHLKPDGILVYAVCSMEPEENEEVIQGFLQNHPEFDIFRPKPPSTIDRPLLLSPDGFLVTSPHPHKLDGFFAAAVKRQPPLRPSI